MMRFSYTNNDIYFGNAKTGGAKIFQNTKIGGTHASH